MGVAQHHDAITGTEQDHVAQGKWLKGIETKPLDDVVQDYYNQVKDLIEAKKVQFISQKVLTVHE